MRACVYVCMCVRSSVSSREVWEPTCFHVSAFVCVRVCVRGVCMRALVCACVSVCTCL